jgi:hypothetical protein
MLYGTKQAVSIPTLEEIAAMSPARLKLERIKLKNEISFRRGDAALGGPAKQAEIDEFNRLIRAIEERLGMNGGGAL